jgi:uncharacterized membrane protein
MSVKPIEPAGRVTSRIGRASASFALASAASTLIERAWWLRPDGPLGDLLHPFRPLPPADTSRRARIALACVVGMAAAFVIFFSAYLFAAQDAYLTHSEDMGIMSQALWTTTHGALLHQTVCNIVSDSNCLGDISRLAIHFEPIMLPLALIYHVFPSPKTLQLLQALVVATGAWPAYAIASRRLGSHAVGVGFAALYLLHASLDSAVTFDFHAVTLSAAFLMFVVYFMLSRQDIGLFVAAVLAMSTKEEIALSVGVLALCMVVFQRRWRVGGALLALALAWLVVELRIMDLASPTTAFSPTIGRYAALGSSPVGILVFTATHPLAVVRTYFLDHARLLYLRALVAPAGYLAVFSPLALIITVPALAINMLSNDPAMYSGFLQYTAESIPIVIFASIQGAGVIARAGAAGLEALRRSLAARGELARRLGRLPDLMRPTMRTALAGALVLVALGFSIHDQRDHPFTPLGRSFSWPQITAHTRAADQLVAMIPADVSVSAQSNLVPHLSNRRAIYLFPYRDNSADYVLIDRKGERYPLQSAPATYESDVAGLLGSPAYRVVAERDGLILLARVSN